MSSKKTATGTKKPTTPNKAAKPVTKPKAPKGGQLSILDAAARVLKETAEPMNCKQMVESMLSQKLWSTSGKTPAATLSSAIQREIAGKKTESRFRKTDRGQFVLAG